ncbi:hypothetical protein OK006_10894, partial [Actinobacteria bacterium OK006]
REWGHTDPVALILQHEARQALTNDTPGGKARAVRLDAPHEAEGTVQTGPDVDPQVNFLLIAEEDRSSVVESNPNETLYRFTDLPPETAFTYGFTADDAKNVVGLSRWVHGYPTAQFLSTTRDPKLWLRRKRYRYEITPSRGSDATGVDVTPTMKNLKDSYNFQYEREVVFTGRIDAAAVTGVYDQETKSRGVWDPRQRKVLWAAPDTQPGLPEGWAEALAPVTTSGGDPGTGLTPADQDDVAVRVKSQSGETWWRFSDTGPEAAFADGFTTAKMAEAVMLHERTDDSSEAQAASTPHERELWYGTMRYRYQVDSGSHGAHVGADANATPPKEDAGNEPEVTFSGRVDSRAVVSVYDLHENRTGFWDPATGTVRWGAGDHQSTAQDVTAGVEAGWGGPALLSAELPPRSAATGIAPEQILGSGEVITDRWLPFGSRHGLTRDEVASGRGRTPGERPAAAEEGVEAFTIEADADGRLTVERPPESGERTHIGYDWTWYRDDASGSEVLRFTQRVHLVPDGVTLPELLRLQRGMALALDQLLNSPGYRLPQLQPDRTSGLEETPGPRLDFRLEFVDVIESAHVTVTVRRGLSDANRPMMHRVWFTGEHPAGYVHEYVHGLGVRDDGRQARALLTPGGPRPVTVPPGMVSLMGPLGGPLSPRQLMLAREHLRQIAEVIAPYLHRTPVVQDPERTAQAEARHIDAPARDVDPEVNLDLVHPQDVGLIVESIPGEPPLQRRLADGYDFGRGPGLGDDPDEQQPEESRQAADGLYRESLAPGVTTGGPMPEGSEHERGAIALAHAAFGGSKSAGAAADALAAVRREREEERLVGEINRELKELGGDPVDAAEFRRWDNDLYGDGRRPVEQQRILAIVEYKMSGERPGLAGGAKKKGKKPQQSGPGAAAEPLVAGSSRQETGQRAAGSSRQDEALPVAGSSRQDEAPSGVELVTVPAETVRAVRTAVDKVPYTWRARVLSDTMGLLQKLPYPGDASLESLVGSVYWMLRLPAAPPRQTDTPGGRGDAPTLRERLLSHPHVVYGVARQPGLRKLLEWNPVLTEALSEAPSVLDDLTAAPDAWHAAQTRETAEILARHSVISGMEADPALLSGLISSRYNLLRFWDGRLDVLHQILTMGNGAVEELASNSPEFAAAVLDLPDPVDALWRLGSEAGLVLSLLNQFTRGRVVTAAFFRKVLGDEKLKAVLRRYPEQLNLVFSSEKILDAVRAKPEVLDILSRSSTLTDVLEDMPEVALRLLSDERRITAAVNNPAVAVTLSYSPSYYHSFEDNQLVLELDQTRQPGNSMRPAGVVPGSLAPLSKGKIAGATVRELRDHLKKLNPAFANDHSLSSRDNLVRLLAGQLPHALRRFLPMHTALPNLPAEYTAALAVLLTASRNRIVAAVYSSRDSDRQLLTSLITRSDEHRSLLSRSPAYAFAAYFETRILTTLPLETLANPWVAGAFARTPKLYPLVKGDFGKDLWEALTAEDSALLRLTHRHTTIVPELYEGAWRTVIDNVTSAPRLLNLLLDAYGELSPTHWKHFLTGGLFPVLAQQLHVVAKTPERVRPGVEGGAVRSAGEDDINAWPGRPTALALITFPELLREAVARPGFAQTWKEQPARFDILASSALRAHEARTRGKGTDRGGSGHLDSLLDAVRTAGGNSLITEEGYELQTRLARGLSLLLAGLEARSTREELSAANIRVSDESLDIYATVLRHERLREAALKNRYLAQGLFWLKGISELMTIRPSLLDQFERSPEMLRQIVRTEGLAQLLARDDRSFAKFTESADHRRNFDITWVSVALKNPWWNDAFDEQSHQLVRADRRNVSGLTMASPAVARAIVERSETVHTLAKSPNLVSKLREAEEDVVRAVMATQGRLEASAARP